MEEQRSPCNFQSVRRIIWHDYLKEIILTDNNLPALRVPRSACVSKGDQVCVRDHEAWVQCKNGKAQILPSYVARERARIGGLNLEFLIKEITDPEEFAAYQALSAFHYRAGGLCGRTARLIVRNFHPGYPKVIGYVELATPLYMSKPRAAILDAPFQAQGISWKTWNMSTLRSYIHLIVRVARCLIYPEFRGMGLGKMLIKHAAEFARHRWQVARLKPFFLEISADMLKFVPFTQKAGMVFIGETEGNLARVAKDMAYLLRNQDRVDAGEIVKEDTCGIVDQQVARMNRAALLMEREGWSLEQLVTRLQRLSESTVLRDFHLFYDIVSLPKPTYMQGLIPEAEVFLKNRATNIVPINNKPSLPVVLEPLSEAIIFERVSVMYKSHVRRTFRTHAIQQAFGISPDDISHRVIQDISLTMNPGEVILITGPSGSGKTTLLRLLAKMGHAGLSGIVRWPCNYRPGIFKLVRSKKPLIEIVGGHDVRTALHLMGLVGLSDAFVYLKRFDELSNGQQYRAMVARLIAGGYNVWLADEFGSNLDTVTANVVADRLQRLARQLGAVLIIASSQPGSVALALRPDQVVRLTTAWEHRVLTGQEFLHALPNKYFVFDVPTLRIFPEYLPAIRSGKKRTTIRKGRLALNAGPLLLSTKTEPELVYVTGARQTRFHCLDEEDARRDGFCSLADLHQALFKHYPDLKTNSWVTIVAFDTLLSKGGQECP